MGLNKYMWNEWISHFTSELSTISNVQISLETEWLLFLLITKFQLTVLLSFWNLSNHWHAFPCWGKLPWPWSIGESCFQHFHLQAGLSTCHCALSANFSPFLLLLFLISVPFCFSQKEQDLWEEISPNTCSCIQGTKYLPHGPGSALSLGFADLEQHVWRDVMGWALKQASWVLLVRVT